MKAGPFRIEVSHELDEVRPVWDRLEREGACSPFQTQGWLRPWFGIVAPHFAVEPVFLTVTDAASGEPRLLLPLSRRQEGRLRVVEFPDLGVSDYNAPLVARGMRLGDGERAALWRALRRALPKADVIRLDKVPATIEGEPNPLAHLSATHRLELNSWGVALPASRAAYDKGVLSASFAKELRRKGRRLESRGAVAFRHPESEADARAIFAALNEQRQQRFEELGRHNILAEPVFRAFYEAVLFETWPNSLGVLSALTVEGEIVATLLALRHRAAYHLVMSTFVAGSWKSASPGNLALDRAVTALIGSGVTYLDFTIGNEPYKRDFGATSEPLYAGRHALSPAGLPHALVFALKAGLSRRLGPKLVKRIRALLSRPAGDQG